jgi:hypothetical protein
LQLVAKSKREGDNIVGIFRDDGETGTNMKRSGFKDMIARATLFRTPFLHELG